MSNITRQIELKDSHSLEDAMRAFGRAHRLDLLAPKIGCSANVLRNKLNPDQEFHKLTLNESVLLASNTGDISLLRAATQMIGHDVHETNESSCESELLHLVFQSVSKAANITSIFDRANQDKHIDELERAALVKATNDAIKTLQELNGSLKVA